MTGQKILLPYNFTANDRKALDFVIRTFSKQDHVEITLYNAYIPTPDIDLRGSPVMEKMKNQLDQLAKKVYEQEHALKEVKKKLLHGGLSKDQVKHIFEPVKKNIASDIVAHMKNGNYDVLVLNRTPAKITRFFTRSVFFNVVSTIKDVTVCIVS
jgi:hypothetical protein